MLLLRSELGARGIHFHYTSHKTVIPEQAETYRADKKSIFRHCRLLKTMTCCNLVGTVGMQAELWHTDQYSYHRHPASSSLCCSGYRSIVLLLFLQKQNLATAIYLFGLGTLLTGLGLNHMRIRSHHDLDGALVTSLLLGRPWWSTTSPTCLPLSVFTITSDQHRCRIPPLL